MRGKKGSVGDMQADVLFRFQHPRNRPPTQCLCGSASVPPCRLGMSDNCINQTMKPAEYHPKPCKQGIYGIVDNSVRICSVLASCWSLSDLRYVNLVDNSVENSTISNSLKNVRTVPNPSSTLPAILWITHIRNLVDNSKM
jgi:hypothetical protein